MTPPKRERAESADSTRSVAEGHVWLRQLQHGSLSPFKASRMVLMSRTFTHPSPPQGATSALSQSHPVLGSGPPPKHAMAHNRSSGFTYPSCVASAVGQCKRPGAVPGGPSGLRFHGCPPTSTLRKPPG